MPLLNQGNDAAAADSSDGDGDGGDDNGCDFAAVCLDQDSLMIPSLDWIH